MSEASPICRGKNLTFETVLSFVNAMPKLPLPKDKFNSFAEERLKGWAQTHSQIARQLAFYYEENGICYPRFNDNTEKSDLFKYMENWARKYFVPNPYTPSLFDYEPKNIYAGLRILHNKGVLKFDEACDLLFGIHLNNIDKVRVYLNNFTNLLIDDNSISINKGIPDENIPNEKPSIEFWNDAKKYFEYFSDYTSARLAIHKIDLSHSLQQIYYGAPGTGKSYTINAIINNEKANTIRTTFHPDTDYSSFVGAYKPTTIEEPVMTVIGTKAVPVENADGTPRIESKIVYEFVSQSFLKAYVNAWKLYSKINEANNVEKQFLVIEEINRGNCAQIFGDLFQLLDRNEYGFSDYPIEADADMQKQLRKEFVGLEIPLHDDINALYKDAERDIVEEVLQGKILLLPNNLYIWATMNTSDQSLFPIDSAFKRRWDWEYMPISNANKDWIITVNHQSYDWWKFLEAINKLIGNTTYSEDKKLGYFFCKAQDNVISAERFVGKVIFYLWNDVFKDYGFEGEAFTDQEGGKLSFDKFYVSTNHRHHEVNENKVEMFLKNLGLEPITNNITEDDENQNVDVEGNKKKSFKVNNINVGNINAIPYTTIQEFIRLNPGMKANDVYQKWEPLKKCSYKTWLLDDEEAHQTRKIESPTEAKYSEKVICGDNKPVYVNKDGWMHNPMKQRDTLTEFIEEVHKLNLGITITEL